MRALAYLLTLSLAATLAVVALGCGKRQQFYAPPAQLAGGVYVKVIKAQARGERLYIEAHVTNHSGEAIRVDRDAWTLRLPSGEVLPRSTGRTTGHDLYVIEPDQGREVHVDFRKDGFDLATVDSAQLIVGGIWFAADGQPQVIGEIPLSTTATLPYEDPGPNLGGAPPAPPASAQPPQPTAQPDVSSAPSAEPVPSAEPMPSTQPDASAQPDTPLPEATSGPSAQPSAAAPTHGPGA